MSLPAGRISCVICAYNEGERIAHVLDAVVGNPLFGEIIVIDDGCTDDTVARVREYSSVTLHSHSPNQGKSYALARGVLAAQCENVMLLDADLMGLSPEHIESLAAPVLQGVGRHEHQLEGGIASGFTE